MGKIWFWDSSKKAARNEQIKLTATFLNNVAVAVVVVSVVTPVLSFIVDRPLPLIFMGASFGVILSFMLHFWARCSLDEMKE